MQECVFCGYIYIHACVCKCYCVCMWLYCGIYTLILSHPGCMSMCHLGICTWQISHGNCHLNKKGREVPLEGDLEAVTKAVRSAWCKRPKSRKTAGICGIMPEILIDSCWRSSSEDFRYSVVSGCGSW